MKKSFLKVLSIVLTATMLLGMIPFASMTAFADAATLAETGQCGDNVYWTYSSTSRNAEITGAGAMYNYSPQNSSPFGNLGIMLTYVNIASGVTSIGDYAFADSGLYAFDIANTVTRIGDYAFSGSRQLNVLAHHFNSDDEIIVIPDSVTYLGEGAFYGCVKLLKITLGSGITQIKAHTFDGCESLETITIPSNVTSIGDSAFANCTSFSSVVIPASVTSIGTDAFDNCANDLVIYCTANSAALSYAQSNSIDYVVIPAVLDENTSGKCGDNVYWTLDSQTGELNIFGRGEMSYSYRPSGSEGMFSGNTAITSVVIESGVKSMDSYIFKDCVNLESVTIPATISSIPWYAFSGCSSLETVNGMSGVTGISGYAFMDCTSLGSFAIPNSVTYLGDSVFEGCTGLTSVTIGNGVTGIPKNAFTRCTSLTTINGGSSVTSIYEGAFNSCIALTTLTLPDSVTTIDLNAFGGNCAIQTMNIGAGLTGSLSNITAIQGCENLTTINVSANNTQLSSFDGVLYNKSMTTLLYYPRANTRTTYTVPDSVTSFDYYAWLQGADSLQTIILGSGATTNCLGHFYFNRLKNLSRIEVSAQNANLCSDAYGVVYSKDMTTLVKCPFALSCAEYTVASGTTTIGFMAFAECTGVEKIIIPDTLTTIGGRAFQYCSGLKKITLGNGITEIPNHCFEGCSSLQSIVISDSVTTIGAYSFVNCRKLKTITIPDSVTTIGSFAFENCYALENVAISDNVTSCGVNVFANCSKLTIVCSKDSYIHQYAVSNKINFVLVSDLDVDDLRLANATAVSDGNTITLTANQGATQINLYPSLKDGTTIEFSNFTGGAKTSKNGTLYAKTYGTATATIDDETVNIIFDFGEEDYDIEHQLRFANASISVENKVITLVPSVGATQVNVYPTLTDKSPVNFTDLSSGIGISKNGTLYSRGSGTVTATIKGIEYTIVFDFESSNLTLTDKLRVVNATVSIESTTITLTADQGATQVNLYPTLTDGTVLTFSNLTGGAGVSKSGTLYAKKNGTAKATINGVEFTVNIVLTQQEVVAPITDFLNTRNATKSISGNEITLTVVPGEYQINLYTRMTDGRTLTISNGKGIGYSTNGTAYARSNASCRITVDAETYTVYFVF